MVFKILISKPASQAVVTVAVFSFQLYERLTVSGRAYGESALLPLPDDEVLFGFQLFQQRS